MGGFLKRIGKKWDRQIEADSEAGKLDFLIREATAEFRLYVLK